jgi:hypothetical protein
MVTKRPRTDRVGARFHARLRDVYEAAARDERPVVGVVFMDPAGVTGTCGLAVVSGAEPYVRVDGDYIELAPRYAPVPHYAGPPCDQRTFRWLADEVSKLCRPAAPGLPYGRVIFAAEQDAFGPSIGRKLGIGIGAIEGTLVDINAIPVNSRVDVSSVTWRRLAGMPARQGRKGYKERAIAMAKPYVGGVDIDGNAAEAVLGGLAVWGVGVELDTYPRAVGA